MKCTRTYVKRFFVACFLSFFELISTNPIYLFCATIPPTPIIWNSRVYIKIHHKLKILILGSNHPEIFLEKGVLEIRSKFTGERPCRRTISIKLQCSAVNFAEYFHKTFFLEQLWTAASEYSCCVDEICKNAGQKLNALSSRTPNMDLPKRCMLVNAFFLSQFSYCPLVWMCHSCIKNNKINKAL